MTPKTNNHLWTVNDRQKYLTQKITQYTSSVTLQDNSNQAGGWKKSVIINQLNL